MFDLALVTSHTFCTFMPLLKNVLLPVLKYTVDLQCISTILFAIFASTLKSMKEAQQCTVMEDMGSLNSTIILTLASQPESNLCVPQIYLHCT